MLLVLAIVGLLPFASAQQQCSDSGLGPCLGGTCPGGFTCINEGTPSETCCNPALIVNPTTPPPPITTVPTGPPPVVTGATTAAPGTCVDLLNPNTGVSDCPRMAAYCTNSAYYDLMTQQCPRTCNRCTGTGVTSGNCVDLTNPNTGVSDCPRMAAYCTNSAYYDLMTQQCPRTCGRCSGTATTIPSTCVDLLNPNTGVSDCPRLAAYCNDSNYYTLMTQQCPRTCNRCSGSTVTTAPTTCVDLLNPTTGVSDCPSRASLCNNSAYYTLMTQQCPRTCGRCTSG